MDRIREHSKSSSWFDRHDFLHVCTVTRRPFALGVFAMVAITAVWTLQGHLPSLSSESGTHPLSQICIALLLTAIILAPDREHTSVLSDLFAVSSVLLVLLWALETYVTGENALEGGLDRFLAPQFRDQVNAGALTMLSIGALSISFLLRCWVPWSAGVITLGSLLVPTAVLLGHVEGEIFHKFQTSDLTSVLLLLSGQALIFLQLNSPVFRGVVADGRPGRTARIMLFASVTVFILAVLSVAVLNTHLDEVSRSTVFVMSFLTALVVMVLVQGAVQEAAEIRHEKTETEMAHLVRTDPLTGLLNRRGLQEQARAFEEEAPRAGVLLIDLDHFKRVNDLYGHEVGDEVLTNVAERLTAKTRRLDSVGRWGGEEFIVVATDVTSASLLRLAVKLRREVENGVTLAHRNLHLDITASIGACIFDSDVDDLASAIRRADAALYRAKSQGRNRVRLFGDGMDSHDAEIEYKTFDVEQSTRRKLAKVRP